MSQSTFRNLYLQRQSWRPAFRRTLQRDFDDILAAWRRPGQVNLLGLSALVGAVKDAQAHARRLYYARSLIICALALALLIAVGLLGHLSHVFAFGG